MGNSVAIVNFKFHLAISINGLTLPITLAIIFLTIIYGDNYGT